MGGSEDARSPGEHGDNGGGYGQTLTILVVEDDEAVADLVRTVLNRVPGWGATVVHDAAAASEVFRHVRVEVLVLDVNLPGISGLELLELLRRNPNWREPPVILMSARPDQPAVQTTLVKGATMRFIAKPFDVDELVAAVHAAAAALRQAGPRPRQVPRLPN
jgi:DNA-binding response OmpR family regulator